MLATIKLQTGEDVIGHVHFPFTLNFLKSKKLSNFRSHKFIVISDPLLILHYYDNEMGAHSINLVQWMPYTIGHYERVESDKIITIGRPSIEVINFYNEKIGNIYADMSSMPKMGKGLDHLKTLDNEDDSQVH